MPTTYAIPDGRTVMAATTFTGNGTTQTVTNAVNGVSFQPDLVWQKRRDAAGGNYLVDSVRGASLVLTANDTSADSSSPNFVTGFNSNGWSLGTNNYTNGSTVVGWNWKAGGTAVSNTAGTITSTVSVGATQGFSVVTYTGTGANATVGHGLGVAPSMAIIKRRSTSGSNWLVYHASMTATSALYLNTTEAKQTYSDIWNNTAPTSTVMSLGTTDNCNLNGGTYVGYFFAAVAGYSAFGSYTGNGSADGPFVYTGFRPRFILTKDSSAVGNWFIQDTSRGTYNAVGNSGSPDSPLAANTAGSETDWNGTFSMDILSNGFKIRNTSASMNTSGDTYIYAAFAENPFKYANAR